MYLYQAPRELSGNSSGESVWFLCLVSTTTSKDMLTEVLTDVVSVELFENIIWVAAEPADGAQGSKQGSGLSNCDKQGKCSILSTSINVPFLLCNLHLKFCGLTFLFSVV